MIKRAQALGVSKSTMKRRVREYGISDGPRVVLDDSELDTLARDIQREFPKAVTQSRVRESMHRTDPEGVAMRWLNMTPRAVYSANLCCPYINLTSVLYVGWRIGHLLL